MLLLNLPTPAASFQALSNILNRAIPMSFHTGDTGATSKAYSLLLSTLQHKSPRLHSLLTNSQLGPAPDAYLRGIITSLFTGCLNLDLATRLWDIMVFEGDAVIIRAGVAYLTAMEGKLFSATSRKGVCDIVKAGLDNMTEDEWVQAMRNAGKSNLQ